MIPILSLFSSVVPFLIYLAFTLPALMTLRHRKLDDITLVIWTAFVVCVPIIGPVAFVIIQPGKLDV